MFEGFNFLDGCPNPLPGHFNLEQRFHDPKRNWDKSTEIKMSKERGLFFTRNLTLFPPLLQCIAEEILLTIFVLAMIRGGHSLLE
jgi:hypothetical protein